MKPNKDPILKQENTLFFKRWLKKPTQLGTLAPISQSLAQAAACLLGDPASLREKIVVEIGAGTGRLSRSLLRQGINPDHFYAIELDKELCDFLKNTLPQAHVIEGDALHLKTLLPSNMIKQLDVVYSVIPLMYLPQSMRDALFQSVQEVLKPGGHFYHVCYSPFSPYASRKDIQSTRIISKWLNVPPGFVWTFKNV